MKTRIYFSFISFFLIVSTLSSKECFKSYFINPDYENYAWKHHGFMKTTSSIDSDCNLAGVRSKEVIKWSYGFQYKSLKHRNKSHKRYKLKVYRIPTAKLIGTMDNPESSKYHPDWEKVYTSSLIPISHKNMWITGDVTFQAENGYSYIIYISYQFKAKYGLIWSTGNNRYSVPWRVDNWPKEPEYGYANFKIQIPKSYQQKFTVYAAPMNNIPKHLGLSWSICEVKNDAINKHPCI